MSQRLHQLQNLLEAQPSDCFLRYAIGLELVKSEKFDEAISCFNQLIKSNPEYTATYYQLAQVYLLRNLKEEAEHVLIAGMKLTRDTDHHTFSELQNSLTNLQLGLLDDE